MNQFHELNAAREQNQLHFKWSNLPVVLRTQLIEESQRGLPANGYKLNRNISHLCQPRTEPKSHSPEITFIAFGCDRPTEFFAENEWRINHQQIVYDMRHRLRVRFDEYTLQMANGEYKRNEISGISKTRKICPSGEWRLSGEP